MDINYTRNLIKGKITEVIFEEMFRSTGEFTVLPIGYEHTIPELAQYQHHVHIQKVLENIRNAPDFALISQDKEKVFLVEVKYRQELEPNMILEIAENIYRKWNTVFLFLATQQNFYFESSKSIIENNGNIQILANSWIRKEAQENFLLILKKFIYK